MFLGLGVNICFLVLVSVFVGPSVSVCLLVLVSVFVCWSWCQCLFVGPGVRTIFTGIWGLDLLAAGYEDC